MKLNWLRKPEDRLPIHQSPMAMQAGSLNPQNLVVGGRLGMRYIINGTAVVEHKSTDGPLISDGYSPVVVSPEQLQPKDNT